MINKVKLENPIIDHIYIDVRKDQCETPGKEYTHGVRRRCHNREGYRYRVLSLQTLRPYVGDGFSFSKELIFTDLFEDVSANFSHRLI
jgi:hypothetical protein